MTTALNVTVATDRVSRRAAYRACRTRFVLSSRLLELPIAPAFAAGLPIAPATIPLPAIARCSVLLPCAAVFCCSVLQRSATRAIQHERDCVYAGKIFVARCSVLLNCVVAVFYCSVLLQLLECGATRISERKQLHSYPQNLGVARQEVLNCYMCHTAAEHCSNTLQQHSAAIHCNNTLQQQTAHATGSIADCCCNVLLQCIAAECCCSALLQCDANRIPERARLCSCRQSRGVVQHSCVVAVFYCSVLLQYVGVWCN